MQTVEEYMEHLETINESYQWPLESFNSRKSERADIHKDFPYVVTYAGHYGYGSQLDAMNAWCREKFGDSHGVCHWDGCEYSFDKWYHENEFDEKLERVVDEKAGVRPDRDDKKAWDAWQKISDALINEHFDMIKARTDKPEEHSHSGIWTHYFVVKTGYDYGYQDYCFKNAEDAVYFKIMWDGEQ